MRHTRRFPAWFAVWLTAGWLLVSGSACLGEERAREFLDGLRQPERGYYDMALAYLERLRTSPNCPADLKEVIDFEVGVTHMAASLAIGSQQTRERQLELAREAFGKFIAEHSDHELAASAVTELGNALRRSGRAKVESAKKPSKSQEEREALLLAARRQFEEGKTTLVDAEKRVYEAGKAVREVPLDPDDPESVDAYKESLADLMMARVWLAEAEYEIGTTHDPASAEFKQALTAAAEKFAAIYKDRGGMVGGLFSRMREGAMYKELGQYDNAIDVLKDLMLTLGDETLGQRSLKTQSRILLIETYLLPDQKKFAEAVALVNEWRDSAADHEKSTAEGLKLILLGGRASFELAKSLPPADVNRKAALKEAKTQLEFVSRFHGELGRQADSLLADEIFGGRAEPQGLPADYAGAKQRGDLAYGNMSIAMGRLQQAKDAQQQAELSATMNEAGHEAILYYRLAERLQTSETPLIEVNLLRFRMTILHWTAQDYYRAAVLGEFLARRYPQSVGARKAAEISVKAYRNLFTQALKRSQDTSFATRRMTSLAELVAARWQGEPVADEACLMLIETAIDNKNYAAASGYLKNMSPDSPRRAAAELRVGKSLWDGYKQAAALKENRPPQEELDQMVQQARRTLELGIQRMRKVVDEGGPVEYRLVFSVLTLAGILVDTGEPTQAVALLEDPKIGPVALSLAEHPATAPGSFRVDALRVALMAYVGAKQLGKAEETMNNLERVVAADGDAEAGKKLTKIYIQLGKKLEERLTRLRNGNKEDKRQAQAVAEAFEEFLRRIATRPQGNTYRSLLWVAETFVSLGAAMDPGVGDTPPEAIEYYSQAEATYLRMLNDLSADEKPAGADERLNVRRAACLRAMGQYQTAMILLVGILEDHERRVDIQIEAARTYQAWGRQTSGYYLKAIVGGEARDGHKLVWGWSGLANKLYAYDDFRPQFHEARYNAAVCRKEYALTFTDRGKRNQTLKQAETDIRRIYQLYPVMGGPDRFLQYDALLKNIQKLRGERSPQGLRGSE